MDIAKLVSDAFGVTLVNALGLIIFWFIGKSLFTKALDAAAANTLEKRKNDFARELEDIRQRFARDLESERAAFQARMEVERRDAARLLEEFKADLTLGAEVRRQVAQKKVGCLLEIVAAGEPLIRHAVNGSADDMPSQMHAFLEFMQLVRRSQHLFSKKTAEALYAYNAAMAKHMAKWNDSHDYATIEAAGATSEHFLDLIRSEMGVQ